MSDTLSFTPVNKPRTVERVLAGQPVMDGAGVKISRLLTQALQRRLDPFLMLDNLVSDQPMVAGRLRHRDSAGRAGLLATGGVRITAPASGCVILVAGKPLNEPIAQYGPLVMNAPAEIYQAVQDFREGGVGQTTVCSSCARPSSRSPARLLFLYTGGKIILTSMPCPHPTIATHTTITRAAPTCTRTCRATPSTRTHSKAVASAPWPGRWD